MADDDKKRFNQAIQLFEDEKYQQGSDLLFDLARAGHLDSIEQLVYIFLDQKDYATVDLVINYFRDERNPMILYLKARLTEEKTGLDSAREQFFEAALAGSPNACAAMAEYLIEDGMLDEAESWVNKAEELKFHNIENLKDSLNEAREFDEGNSFNPIPLSEFSFAAEVNFLSGNQIFTDPSYLENDFLKEIEQEMGDEDQSLLNFENGYGFFRKSHQGKRAIFIHLLPGEDKRVDSILICEDLDTWKGSKLKSSKREQISFDDLEEIGSITVDSGQILIADLEELKNYNPESTNRLGEKSEHYLDYDLISSLTVGSKPYGAIGNVFATSTGYGDGTYNVYEFTDSEKRSFIFMDFLNFIEE